MADPRLNSVHLEPPRRQHYRRARRQLLQACGEQTLYSRPVPTDQPADSSDPTLNARAGHARRHRSACWLASPRLVYPLEVGFNTLGRASDNDIVVADACISRRHCAVVVHRDHTCEIHDTASRNGTYVNGVRVASPTRLKPGDEVRISQQTFLFMASPSLEDAGSDPGQTRSD